VENELYRDNTRIESPGSEWTPSLSKRFSERSLVAAGSRTGLRSQQFMPKGYV